MPDGALVAKRDAPVGGQAVLEGVMMRGVSTWAVAVRNPDGQIEISSESLDPWAQRHRLWRLPVIRGVVALGESMKIGFKALAISANAQLEEDEEGEAEEIGGWVWGLTIALSLALAIGLFFVIPVGLTSLIKDQLGSPFLFWLVEGVLRTAIFIGYIVAISRLPDLRRVFEYHGAEHKTISCYEAEDELDPGAGEALLAPAPALRHQLPADRDGAGDLRLRADRAARLVLAGRLAHPRHPADRRPLLRGDQVGRQEPAQTLGAGGDVAGPDAAEPDHARARRRAARGGDRRARERARAARPRGGRASRRSRSSPSATRRAARARLLL